MIFLTWFCRSVVASFSTSARNFSGDINVKNMDVKYQSDTERRARLAS